MFIVPSTFSRGRPARGAVAESTIRRVSIDRVDLGRVDDPPQQRVLGADADELGALAARSVGSSGLTPMITSTSASRLELLREAAAPVAGEAGDQDAALHPSQTDLRSASIS